MLLFFSFYAAFAMITLWVKLGLHDTAVQIEKFSVYAVLLAAAVVHSWHTQV